MLCDTEDGKPKGWLALKVSCSRLMAALAAMCSSAGMTEPREFTRSATLAPW